MYLEKEIAALNREEAELEDKRKKLKAAAVNHRDEASQNKAVADLTEIRDRLDEIKKEREKLTAQKQAETNQRNNEEIKNIMNAHAEKPTGAINKTLVRTAFAKLMRGEKPTDEEFKMYQRALANPSVENGQSATTTSTEFTAVAADAIGINNGGLFIPESVLLDILREDVLESPILNDVMTTAIKGMIKYPYLVSKTPAKKKPELDQTDSKNIEWGILSGKTGNYTTSIIITFEAKAQTIEEFIPYLFELIRDSIRDIIIQDYIYGTGEDDSVVGITKDAIAANYASTATIQEILEPAVKKVPVKKRNGSKIYLSTALYDKIMFAKDSNGDYIRPIFTGLQGTLFGPFEYVHEPNLNDGDFIIGNVRRWYKANIIKPMELGVDTSNKKRIDEWSAHAMINAVPVPQSFVYGKLA